MLINEIFKPGRIISGQTTYVDKNRATEIAEFIQRKCKIILSMYNDTHRILYRGQGLRDDVNKEIFIGKPRMDRMPKDTFPAIHHALDKKLKAAGFLARRGNSLFVTSAEDRANSYGRKYVIFPLDGFKYTWTPIAQDLTSDLGLYDYSNSRFATDLQTLNAYAFVETYDFKNSSELERALLNGNEVYIRGTYIAIYADSSLFLEVFKKLMPVDAIILTRLTTHGDYIEHVKNPSDLMIKLAIKTYPAAYRFYNNPTDEMKFIALRLNPYVLRYMENPSEEIKEFAIKYDAFTIMMIKNPSEKLQLIAVSRQPEIILQLLQQGVASEKVKLMAVETHPDVIRYINHPSKEVQIAAVTASPSIIAHIDNPCEEAKVIAGIK